MTLLKQIRLKNNLTQKDVAKHLRVETRHYQYVESGKSFLSQERLNKLEDLFQLPQRVLLAKNIEEVPDFYKSHLEKINKD